MAPPIKASRHSALSRTTTNCGCRLLVSLLVLFDLVLFDLVLFDLVLFDLVLFDLVLFDLAHGATFSSTEREM